MQRLRTNFKQASQLDRRLQSIARSTGPIIATGPGDLHYAHGTAFIVGDRLAITAAHVVLGYLQHVHGIDLYDQATMPRRAKGPTQMGLVILVPGIAKKMCQLEIINTRILNPGDVALLELGNSPNYPWQAMGPYPQLRLMGPRLSERVVGLGYPGKGVRRVRSNQLRVDMTMKFAEGKVEDMDNEPTSLSSRRVPRFQTNAEYLPGMSGGPILGEDGRICGVVASSIKGEAGISSVSFGSILWPLTSVLLIRRVLRKHSTKQPRKLIHTGLIDIADYELVPPSMRALPMLNIQGKQA